MVALWINGNIRNGVTYGNPGIFSPVCCCHISHIGRSTKIFKKQNGFVISSSERKAHSSWFIVHSMINRPKIVSICQILFDGPANEQQSQKTGLFDIMGFWKAGSHNKKKKFKGKNGFKAADYVQGQGVTQIKSGAYTKYASILIWGTTPPLSVRCGFETIFLALT